MDPFRTRLRHAPDVEVTEDILDLDRSCVFDAAEASGVSGAPGGGNTCTHAGHVYAPSPRH